jgi:2-polyprenyl-6-methoxyphenol hydroxylase-like FAD-dependent oxidoreductase
MIQRALVVGGGIGGMATAISLRKIGIAVDLIDLDPKWRVYGAGITITGATLRAFKALGILDAVMEQAYTGEGIQICDVNGHHLHRVPTPVAAGGDTPGCGGIMRPILHKILSASTLELGTQVRLGLTVDAIESDDQGASVRFSDGSQGRYDLVVGADGVFSRVRSLLFPQAPSPQYTGQCVWRIVAPRPASIERRHFFLGGPAKVGLTPVSRDEMYMFLLETTPKRSPMPDSELHVELRRLLQGYGGILSEIRDKLGAHSSVILRPLEGFLLPRPWQKGNAILIGDAAHPTTPQLASGAGLAVEDGLVLADEIARASSVAEALDRFMERRYERCRLVVENSLEIGRLEQECAPPERQTQIVKDSLEILAQPV